VDRLWRSGRRRRGARRDRRSPRAARLEESPAIDYACCERMRCVGVVVDATTAARVDLGALGSALALEPGERVLRIPLPPQ
jgi:hypothetical protein